MKFYILFIENNLGYAIQDDLDKFFDWVNRKFGVKVCPEYIKTDLPLTWKDFGVKVGDVTYWGLNEIKGQLRATDRIDDKYYNSIFFLYDLVEWSDGKKLAAWTYPQPLFSAEFSEIPITSDWEKRDEIFRMISHEFLHQLHRICWDNKVITKDTMDKYDDEFNTESLTGNRARNITELLPHTAVFTKEPRNRYYKPVLEALVEKLTQLKDLLLAQKKSLIPLLDRFCDAIKQFEGWYPGSHSYKTNNPGNLKYIGQIGTTGQDKNGFAVFKDYRSGYEALRSQIKFAASGRSKYYKPTMNIIEFFHVYAPVRDSNDPDAYALFVCKKVGIDPQTKIKELI
jgi:hypothetical protein